MSFIREVRKDIELEAIRLMREYRANLIVEAKRLCRDDSVAEDLAMKTIEVYMSKLEEELPPAGKSLAYLKSILRNIYHDSVRGKAQACMVYLDPEDIERLDELGPADNSTEEAILAHSDAELVRNAIARLPESARSAIVMHYFESLSISQIAELLKKSPDSVKSNLYYARKVLAKRLGKAFGRTALAIAALLFGGSLLYAAALAIAGVFSPSAPDETAEEPVAAETAAEKPPVAAEAPTAVEQPAIVAAVADAAATPAVETNAAPPNAGLEISNIENKEQTMNANTCTSILAAATLAASSALAATSVGYIKNGLVAHWDGVENAGRGVHDPSATVWKDLVAGREFTLSNVTVADNSMVFKGVQTSYGELSVADTAATFEKASDGTLEIVYAAADNTATKIILQSSEASGHAISVWQGNRLLTVSGSVNNSPYFNFSSGTATNIVSVRYASAKPGDARVSGNQLTTAGLDCWNSATNSTIIGTRNSKANNHFKGAIYSIRVYSRQLTDAEIDANHAIDRKRFIEGDLSPEAVPCAGELIDVSTNSAKVVWRVDTDAPTQVTARFVSGFEPDFSDSVAVPLGTFASGTVVTSAVAFARSAMTYWRIEAKDASGTNFFSLVDMVPAFAGEDLSAAPLQVRFDGPSASCRQEYDCWPISGERASSSATRFVENGNNTSTCVGWTLFAETSADVWTEESYGTTCEASYLPDGRRRRIVWHTAFSQNLPGGYVRLDSISATNGQQRIDTGYSPNYITHSMLDLLFEGKFVNNAPAVIFGTDYSHEYLRFSVNFGGAQSTTLYFWTQKSQGSGGATKSMMVTDSIVKNRNTLSIDMGNGVANYGGISLSIAKRTSEESQPQTVMIFGRDVPFSAYPTMRLFGATFADGSTLRRDFVPAQSLETGRRGLYDFVEGNFHTNIVENGADFGGTICGLHVDGEPSRVGEPTIPYGCSLLESDTAFELAEPNMVREGGNVFYVKSIARYSFNETTGLWELSGRTKGSKVAATYTGEPVRYVLEWSRGGTGFVISLH